MTETTTPTGDSDQDSSGITNEPLLDDKNTEQSSAVEGNETETESTEQSTDSGSDDKSSTTEESSNDNSEEDITAFAKSQGYDPTTLTANEKKLLTQLKKNSAEKRKEIEAGNSKKLDKEVTDLYAPEGTDRIADIEKRQALLDARQQKQDFWDQNPEDRAYEAKMAEILLKEKEDFGPDAARQLAKNLPRLLREAKFAEGAFDSDAARDAGRREEREELRKKQEAGADSAHASTSSASGDTKINAEWVENEYDPFNPEHRKMLDAAVARGDLY